jgi:tetratricopeptide (TPR) repeat protein
LIETGLGQINAEDYDAATGTFNSVLTLEPGNVYALYNLGYIAQVEEDVATAVAQYNQAISVDPEFAPALYNLALLTESADLQASVDLYRRVIEQEPEYAAAYMRLGFALQELGQEQEGQEFLDQGIELDASMAEVEPPKYK